MKIPSRRHRARLLAAAGVALFCTGGLLHAQDDDAPAPPAAGEASGDEDGETPAVEAPLDEESYLDIEEEDFTPSEEVPTDQSIAFPTDI